MLAVSKHHSVGNNMYRTDKVLTILAARQYSVRLAGVQTMRAIAISLLRRWAES
jgi:hypothetical protein